MIEGIVRHIAVDARIGGQRVVLVFACQLEAQGSAVQLRAPGLARKGQRVERRARAQAEMLGLGLDKTADLIGLGFDLREIKTVVGRLHHWDDGAGGSAEQQCSQRKALH